MVNGGVMRRVPGTTTYRSPDTSTAYGNSLAVPGSKPSGERMALPSTPPGKAPPKPNGALTLNAGEQDPEDMSTAALGKRIAETPLMAPDTFSGQNSDSALGYGVDAAQSALNAGAGMTSPENIAIMAATMGLSAVPGILAKLGSAGVSAYFATQAGQQAMEQFPELKHHAEQGDWHAVAANAGAIAANVGMAAGAGKHALGELHGAASMDVSAQQRAKTEPPTKVKSVSPATPNPPTAALATTPEAPATIALQMQQMGTHGEPLRPDQRKVVMFPRGQGQPAELPPGVAVTHDSFGNTYAYRPDLLTPGEIHTAAKNNTLPELLGGPQGMGAPDKTALQGNPVAVVARGPDGVEAQSTATDQASLPQTIEATRDVVPPGGTLGVEHPSGVVSERAGIPDGIDIVEPAANVVAERRGYGPPAISDGALYHGTRSGEDALQILDSGEIRPGAAREVALSTNAEHNAGRYPVQFELDPQAVGPVRPYDYWEGKPYQRGEGDYVPGGGILDPRHEFEARASSAIPVSAIKAIRFTGAEPDGLRGEIERKASELGIPVFNADGPSVEGATPRRSAEPVYMGSLFGGLHQAYDSAAQMFHESAAEMRAKLEKRRLAKAEIERAAASPQENEFGTKTREWYTGERDFWGARVNQLVDQVRKIIPDGLDQQALSLYRDFKSRPNELQQFLDGTHPDFQDPAQLARIEKLRPVIERALHPTRELLHADQALTTLADASLSEGQKLGFLDSSMTPDEYVKHMLNPKDTLLDPNGEPIPTAYSGMKDFGRAIGGKLGRQFDSASKRNYPTLLHAVGEGLAPKTLNALDAMTIYGDKFATARATHMLIDQLKDLGVGKWGMGTKNIPDGWVEIAPHAHPFQNNLVIPDKNGEPAGVRQTLYVPKYIERAMRPITDPDYTNKIMGFSQWRGFGAYTKAVQLGMSLFHATTENYMAMANMGPKGWAKALTYNRESPLFLSEERDGILHGLTTPVQGHTFEAYKGLSPGSIPTWGDIWRSNPVMKQADKLAQGITDFTFGKLQRQFKVYNYAMEKAGWLADHPNATPAEYNAAMHSITKEINAVYGGLHTENIGTVAGMTLNKATTEVARAIMLAPDWSFSNIFNVKYALESKTPAGKMARAFWLRSMVGGMIGTQMLSLALSGKMSKNPTQVYMGNDSDGKEIYQNVFFKGAPGDAVNLVNNVMNVGPVMGLAKVMSGKMNPLLRTGMQLATNENYLNQKIVPSGSGVLKGAMLGGAAALKGIAPVPLSMTNVYDMLRGPGHETITVPEFFTTALAGTPPKHVYPQNAVSPAEKILMDYRRSQAGPGSAPTEHSRAASRVYLMAKTGDIAKARDLGRQAVAAGTMAPRDVNNAITRARSVPLVSDIRTLEGPDALNVIMQAYDTATPAERLSITPIVRQKLAAARLAPYKWSDDTRALAQKYFNLRPVAVQPPAQDFSSPTPIQ
jgi:hypothetical protein